MGRHNQSSNNNSNNSNKSSNHTGFTSSRVLILLGFLICLAFGSNVYLSIIHDPTRTKNSNVEPIIDALANITIKKLEDDDDLIQAIMKEKKASSSSSANVNVNVAKNQTEKKHHNIQSHKKSKSKSKQ
jgi:hypothetical protein